MSEVAATLVTSWGGFVLAGLAAKLVLDVVREGGA